MIGNGTSYHSALATEVIARRRARHGDADVIALTAGELRHHPMSLGAGDAVVGISASGEFRDVVAVTGALRGRIPTVAVVHVPGSTLARTADHVVVSAGGASAVPVMTKTFASTLTASLLLLGELLGDERADEIAASLWGAAGDAQAAIAGAVAEVEALAARLVTSEHIFVVGGGGAHPAALEASLKLKEMALVHAEGVETWEMETGAATLLGPTSTVVALAPVGPGREAAVALARHAAGWGAHVVEVAPDRSVDGGDLLRVPPTADEDLAALTAVPPVALLACVLARARGIDPDRPSWTERYRSQGHTHVVGTEAAR